MENQNIFNKVTTLPFIVRSAGETLLTGDWGGLTLLSPDCSCCQFAEQSPLTAWPFKSQESPSTIDISLSFSLRSKAAQDPS